MKKARLFPLILVAVMTALATVIYMIFPEIPLVPGVEYLKVDFSDIPALVTALTVGPWYGVLVEVFKNIIHLFRTTTYGIGELMNIGIGSTIMLTMWFFSRLFDKLFKTNTNSAAGYYTACGITILMTILAGWILNAALTPVFFSIAGIPITKASILAGVWGSTLLNTVKSAITVIPMWPVVNAIRRSAKNYI